MARGPDWLPENLQEVAKHFESQLALESGIHARAINIEAIQKACLLAVREFAAGRFVPVVEDANTNWDNNSIQFPRLIEEAQAAAAFTRPRIKLMAESMDLKTSQVEELIDRAAKIWDEIKSRTPRMRKRP